MSFLWSTLWLSGNCLWYLSAIILGPLFHTIVQRGTGFNEPPVDLWGNPFSLHNWKLFIRNVKLMEMWRKTMHGSLPSTTDVPPEIGHLIIIDRGCILHYMSDIDPVTVCSSQLTFEGLLSEVFSIKSGFIEPPNTKEKFLLSDIEPIFNEIRNYPIDKVVPVIQENIKKVQETKAVNTNVLKYKKSMGISSVSDMKQFVTSDLKQTQENKLNLRICKDQLEQWLNSLDWVK
ncbi:hypothetical protein MXB_2616 [Myxobolus squamalis]|nr:hypothetical protein MXB_2616 [Myxobolus squamalis]